MLDTLKFKVETISKSMVSKKDPSGEGSVQVEVATIGLVKIADTDSNNSIDLPTGRIVLRCFDCNEAAGFALNKEYNLSLSPVV